LKARLPKEKRINPSLDIFVDKSLRTRHRSSFPPFRVSLCGSYVTVAGAANAPGTFLDCRLARSMIHS
jgi:hypothetical protein